MEAIMADLSEERMGEIALALIKLRLQKEGIRLSNSTRREIGQAAKDTGISREDLEQFQIQLLPEFIGNALGFKHVDLTTSERVPYVEPQRDHDHHDGHGHGYGGGH